jgi:hypothetical protein
MASARIQKIARCIAAPGHGADAPFVAGLACRWAGLFVAGVIRRRGYSSPGLFVAGVIRRWAYSLPGLFVAGLIRCWGYSSRGLFVAGVVRCRDYSSLAIFVAGLFVTGLIRR